MQNLLALTQRELKAFWYSPVAYAVGAVFLFLQGLIFGLLIMALSDPRIDPSWTMAQFFFSGTFFFWFFVLIVPPLLTMRTFSEEKRTGSIELLLTAPVTDAQVVLAKFLGAWLAYCSLWAFTLIFFIALRWLTPFDWGPVLAGYLGTGLLGAILISAGVFASSLTRNQVIAALCAFGATLALFTVGILDVFVHDPEAGKIIRYLSLMEHLRDFSKGILDTRPVSSTSA